MRAIKAVGGDLKVAFDPSDSVGVIDSYFPDAHFFTEFEHFDRHIGKLRRQAESIDYVSICSPNHLHDAHVRFALRSGSHAICEKPLVLDPRNVDGLRETEDSTGRKVSTILQLRLHPVIGALKQRIAGANRRHRVELTYITARGRWYRGSWKGDESKSGGVATNIGIHLFDMLAHVFGPPALNVVHLHTPERAAGFLECGRADVCWFLSIDRADLPAPAAANNRTSYRSIALDGDEIKFSDGFTELHTRSYEEIVAGRGFGLDEARSSVEIVSAFRCGAVNLSAGERHPMVARFL